MNEAVKEESPTSRLTPVLGGGQEGIGNIGTHSPPHIHGGTKR